MHEKFVSVRNKLIVLGLAALLAMTAELKAESCVMIADADGIPTPTLYYDDRLFTLEPAFEDYQFMLADACDAWGLDLNAGCDIFPMMGAIDWNAVATICDGNKVIVYDRRLSQNVGYDGALAVIAHELGHHLCKHLGIKPANYTESHKRELEADRFAGATMRRIGFTKETALSYLHLLAELPSESHPSRAERRAALLAGWNDPQTGLACINE